MMEAVLMHETVYYNKNGVRVRPTYLIDTFRISRHLRESDRNEVWASHHHGVEHAVRFSFESAISCLTVEWRGVPVALFGISPASLVSDRASIWLLATDGFDVLIRTMKTEFVRQSKRFISLFLEQYPLLENYVDARNTLSIKWLRLCGATIEQAQPYGAEGLLFHYFYFRKLYV